MSAILGSSVTGAGGGAYTVNNSVRLRASATGYFSRTLASSGNTNQWTFSTWLKRGQLYATSGNPYQYCIFAAGTFGSVAATNALFFNAADNVLQFYIYDGSNFLINCDTYPAYFRDPSAWYHIVVVFDGQNATAANRVKMYVNNVQYTLRYTQNTTASSYINNSSYTQLIGRDPRPGTTYENPYDGYLAETQFVNAQLLTPSSFGETNASTGVWQPKAYTGTYGTNGFYLKYSDIATTSGSNAGLGKDFSGNGNYWNTNNISVTSGVTYDAMTDSPTPASSTVGNFAVMNPVNNRSGATISGGNLNLTTSGNWDAVFATLGSSSGKFYCELTLTTLGNGCFFGVATESNINSNSFVDNNYIGKFSNDYGFRINDYGAGSSNNEGYSTNASFTSLGTVQPANGNIYGLALDLDNQKIYWSKNGTWYNSANPSSGTNGISIASATQYFIGASPQSSCVVSINFGQRPFSYTPPTGFKRLCTYNLTTPTIGASSTTLANKYFDALIYTGNGASNRALTGLNFQPDFVWNKARSNAYAHKLYDAVRGVTKQLYTNLTDAEATTGTANLVSFDSNGITIGNDTGFNGSGVTFVDWFWKANGAGVTNTSGSITSTISANTTSGFSVVTWTGNGTNPSTVGHGLGTAPKMIISMPRSFVSDKYVYHASLGAANYVSINLAAASASTTLWNSTTPTASVFTVYGNGTNQNTSTYVAYCFAEIAGFSKFGSYTGNGSTDGPFVYCGFRPRFVLFKNSSAAGNDWKIFDAVRNTYNVVTQVLYPNLGNAEDANTGLDFTANGFKVRDSGTAFNGSGNTIIFAAFAESPFNYSLAR